MLKDEDWKRIIQIDLEGAWRFAKAMITYFRGVEPRVLREDQARGPMWEPVKQRGSIVVVSSSLGSEGKAHLAAYCESERFND